MPIARPQLVVQLLTASVTTALARLLCLPAARALGLRRFRGRSLVLPVLFLPNAVPPLAIGMGL